MPQYLLGPKNNKINFKKSHFWGGQPFHHVRIMHSENSIIPQAGLWCSKIFYRISFNGSKLMGSSNLLSRSWHWYSRHLPPETVDSCTSFIRMFLSFSTWRWLRAISTPRSENVHNFLMTVRKMSWTCDLVAEILLIPKNMFSTR